jgi:hypothetical protein
MRRVWDSSEKNNNRKATGTIRFVLLAHAKIYSKFGLEMSIEAPLERWLWVADLSIIY